MAKKKFKTYHLRMVTTHGKVIDEVFKSRSSRLNKVKQTVVNKLGLTPENCKEIQIERVDGDNR